VNYVRELLKYTLWADRVVATSLVDVAPEHLLQPTGSSWDSVLGTMAHVLGAQRMWLSRFIGDPLPAVPGLAEYPDLPTLRAGMDELRAELEMYMAGLTDAMLRADLTWVNSKGQPFTRPLWEPVLHLCNHSTYHRGQVATMLRQLGYQPVPTDLIYYLIDHDGT
jgi:uncharacterized damage-inducible protein DinB